jgi:hypothetical protein
VDATFFSLSIHHPKIVAVRGVFDRREVVSAGDFEPIGVVFVLFVLPLLYL